MPVHKQPKNCRGPSEVSQQLQGTAPPVVARRGSSSKSSRFDAARLRPDSRRRGRRRARRALRWWGGGRYRASRLSGYVHPLADLGRRIWPSAASAHPGPVKKSSRDGHPVEVHHFHECPGQEPSPCRSAVPCTVPVETARRGPLGAGNALRSALWLPSSGWSAVPPDSRESCTEADGDAGSRRPRSARARELRACACNRRPAPCVPGSVSYGLTTACATVGCWARTASISPSSMR